MREICTSGSEGGGALSAPYPYHVCLIKVRVVFLLAAIYS